MIDRDHPTEAGDIRQQRVPIRHSGAAHAKVGRGDGAKEIRMSFKGRDLAPRNQQQVVVVGLQLANRIRVRDGVVIGDRDEIEPALACCPSREKQGAGYLLLLPAAGAGTVAVGGVHVQVAPIPTRPGADHRSGWGRAAAIESDVGRVLRLGVAPDVGNSQHQVPRPRPDSSRQIRGCRVGGGNREAALVTPAPAPEAILPTEPVRPQYSEVDGRTQITRGVVEIHRYARSALRYLERHQPPGLVVRTRQRAM